MTQVTVMSVVVLIQANKYREAKRLILNQPIGHAVDLVARAQSLVTNEEWILLQSELHIPETRVIRIPRSSLPVDLQRRLGQVLDVRV